MQIKILYLQILIVILVTLPCEDNSLNILINNNNYNDNVVIENVLNKYLFVGNYPHNDFLNNNYA